MSDLAAIFARQLRLQKESFHGVEPEFFSPEEKMRYITACAYALIDEIGEATDETGWKPWASSNHINREAYKSELVDALHFLVNLFLVAGISAEEVVEGYFAKATKNAKRQAEGYDGVAGKCAVCKRALDDTAVLCTAEQCVLVESETIGVEETVVDQTSPCLDKGEEWIDITWGNALRPTWKHATEPNTYSHDAGITRFRPAPGEHPRDSK